MAGTPILLCPPKLVTTAIADCFATPAATLYYIVTYIHIANINTTAETITVCLSTAGDQTAGTELLKLHSIAGNSEFEVYPRDLKIANTKLINALAGVTTNKMVITIAGQAYAV